MNIRSAHLSDVGKVRKENQDSVGYFPAQPLFVVADGMGGHAGGRQASETAIQTIFDALSEAPTMRMDESDLDDTSKLAFSILTSAIREANERILEAAAADSSLEGMGTTIVAMMLEGDDTGIIAHVGDSRAYRLRAGSFEQLTQDHSLVADLVRRGEITESEAEHHPYRHTLTRALGTKEDTEPDLSLVEIEAGDLFILCSDGIYGMVPESEMQRIIEDNLQDLDAMCEKLVASANDHGGKDNSTVIAVSADG